MLETKAPEWIPGIARTSRVARMIARGLVPIALASVIVGALGALGACTPLATWPPTEGTQALVPWAEPTPQLMGTAVTYTKLNIEPNAPANSPIVFNLPEGTEWKVWELVQKEIGADAKKMDPGESPVYDVHQVRLDGGKAEVDIVYRTNEGVWQMATVHFTGAFGGHYRPIYFQRWVIPVDAPVCHNPGPPPPPPPAPTGAWPK